MPAPFVDTLGALQDNIEASPFDDVRKTIEREFHKPLEELFEDFSVEALGAASIGQVHSAHLRDGTKVAIKVQHLAIDSLMKIDLRNLEILLSWIAWAAPEFDIAPVLEGWSKEVLKELDFSNEASNTERVRRNLSASGLRVIVPKVQSQLTSARVMTSAFSAKQEGRTTDAPLTPPCRVVALVIAHRSYPRQ